MAENFKIKLGTSYLYGSLVGGQLNHMEFDRPVKKLRTPIETLLGAEVDNNEVMFDQMWAGGVLTFTNKGGYPIGFDVAISNDYSGDYFPLVVEEYGDIANEHYFDPEEPEQPEEP